MTRVTTTTIFGIGGTQTFDISVANNDDDFLFPEKKIKYVVDFDPEITEIVTETKMMENLGFSVPEIARNVALQEDKYIQYVDGLKRMLKRYHDVIHSLDQAEVPIY